MTFIPMSPVKILGYERGVVVPKEATGALMLPNLDALRRLES